MHYYKIAVNFPVNSGILTYSSSITLQEGNLVKVPLGKRFELGCVLGLDEAFNPENSRYKIKEVSSLTEDFHLSSLELKLYTWMANYYHYSLGQLIFDCLPKPLKRPRKMEVIKGEASQAVILSEVQEEVYQNISSVIKAGFTQHLIHGITGSGKSAIYMKLMKDILLEGKSILFLLPEINLTPQFIKMFEDYLDVPVYQYHSSVTNSEKFHLWRRLKDSEDPCVIVGVRSSLFLPIENLGLVIVDEEHDYSFKQEDRCHYHGRDVAIYKAMLSGAMLVLGSATPSTESFYRFKTKPQPNCYYHSLKVRYGSGELPKIHVSSLIDQGEEEFFTNKSLELLDESIDRGEQALIFVNRLGFAHYFQCKQCGHQYECPNCSVNLKMYKKKSLMLCHHCNYEKPIPKECSECGSLSFYHKGFGTEQVELKLKTLRPNIKFDRFDRDEIKTFKDLKEKLKSFEEHEFDVFIGTQMLSKGHNFRNVNLVIILGVDSQLNFPDFRSSERVFQLVNQVAGRSGRFSSEGKVVIETLSVGNPIWNYLDKDSDGFYEDELKMRELCSCPPFYKVAVIYFSSRFQDRLIDFVSRESVALRSIEASIPGIIIMGPKPSAIEKRVNKYTWLFWIKAKDNISLNRFLESTKNYLNTPSGISMKIDVDPVNMS